MSRLSQIRGFADSKYAEYLGVSVVLIIAASLRLWSLGQIGFGTQYYAAGVLSMLQNWHNFFFNSFDPAGFVSIDKPPLAFWIQVVSAKVLGFGSFSIHLPQAIEGVVLIGILYHLVRRHFGIAAGLLAAFFAAIMPISVAVDRSNNTDSCLALLLVAAGWALSSATERNSYRLLFLAMGLLGIAFNVKMLAAFVVVPGFMAVYWLGTSLPMLRKVKHLLASFAILMAVSLVWCVIYDLTPAPLRPYAGSTADNSMLELVVGENGARRFARGIGLGGRAGFAQNQNAAPTAAPAAAPAAAPSGTPPVAQNPLGQGTQGLGAGARGRRGGRGGRGGRGRGGRGFNFAGGPGFGGGRGGDNTPIGPFRMLDPGLADQTGWLYPLALLGVVAGFMRRRVTLPLDAKEAAVLLWAGWAVVYGAVLSFAGGIFHSYYIDAMVPPICALAAIGLTQAWDWRRQAGWRAVVLPVSLLLVVAWQFYISFGYQLISPASLQAAMAALTTPNGLPTWLGGISLVAAAIGIAISLLAKKHTRSLLVYCAFAFALLAISLTPIAWALASMQSNAGNSPSATPPRLAAIGGPRFAGGVRNNGNDNGRLIAFLLAHYHDQGFLLATLSSQQAAPIILATGKPVMAIGGFAGADPILTPQRLSDLVEHKQLRFVLVGDGPGGGGRGGNAQAPLIGWIHQHGTVVDSNLWQSAQMAQVAQMTQNRAAQNRAQRFGRGGGRGPRFRQPGGFGGGGGVMQLIDLRPGDDDANNAQ